MLPEQDEYKSASGAVIAADFYHSNALMPLSDEAVVARVRRSLEACEPGFIGAQVRAILGYRTIAILLNGALVSFQISNSSFKFSFWRQLGEGEHEAPPATTPHSICGVGWHLLIVASCQRLLGTEDNQLCCSDSCQSAESVVLILQKSSTRQVSSLVAATLRVALLECQPCFLL